MENKIIIGHKYMHQSGVTATVKEVNSEWVSFVFQGETEVIQCTVAQFNQTFKVG